MTGWWRQTAFGMLLIGILLTLGTHPGQAESRAHVYLLRGLMNIFSLGMDTLGEQLNRHGVYATVHGYGEWQSLADRAAVDFKAGKEGPIILIGHSLGADAVMEMAAYLGRKGIPVALVVPFDGTKSLAASDNVARVLNLTQRDYAYMRKGPGFHGSLANVDVSSDPSIDHINIDKSPRLHARVVSEVLAIVGGHRAAIPGAAKPSSVNAITPAGQDTGTTPAPATGSSASKPEGAPATTPPASTPAKSGNGADAGTALPVADGTPIIASPERTGARQNVDGSVPSQRKPAASPVIRAEQVPN
jgi:alpha-beta hydrolase superfamily lysophospholipase